MVFIPRTLKLLVAGEGKDIVPDDVRLTVVLVKTAVRGTIDHVALDQDAAAAFISVDTPAPVFRGGNVVPEVVDHPRAGLFAEHVDTRHVAEHRTVAVRPHADMMDLIEF